MHVTFVLETCTTVVTLTLLHILLSKQLVTKSFVCVSIILKADEAVITVKTCYKCLTISCSVVMLQQN